MRPGVAKVLALMRKNKLCPWSLIESEGAAVARAWELMDRLDVDYTDIEKALVDLVPGKPR